MGTPGAPVVALAYQYDTLGNVTHVVDTIDGNAGVGTAYVYDHLNRLKTLTQAGTDTSEKRVDFSYNNLGQYTQIARFANLAGTISVANSNYAYDGMNRLTSLTHQRGVGVIDSYGYTYDADSRITRIVSALDGATDYTYDDRDQLTGAEYANAAIPDENFDFDANGNRVASHLHGTGYVTGPGNRLLSDGTFNYEYDGEGNMTKRTNIADGTYREFGWDHRNRLISVTDRSSGGVITNEVTFAYDAMNRRIAKTANGASTLFVYDREDVLLDFADADAGGPGAPVLESRNLHGTGFDEVVAEDHGGGDVHWLLADHLGSTRNVVNASGSLVNHTLVDSYGTVLSQTNPVSDTRFIFTGREFDQESDIHYFRRRYLDPQIGRFLGEDPTRVFGADANPYRYVSNIPILQVDPFGLWGVGVTAGGSVEGGVVVGSGATVSGGVGVFGGGSQGINTGGYVSGGAYSGTPGNNVGYPGGQNVQTGNGVIGGYAGVGVGGFITNATSACQLSGPFSTWSINTPWGSAQFGYSDGTWIGSITVGPGIGGGVSGYPTNTYVP